MLKCNVWGVGRKTFSENLACDGEKTCCTPTAEDDKRSFCLLDALCMASVKIAHVHMLSVRIALLKNCT